MDEAGPDRAGNFLSSLLSAFDRLARAPFMGHARTDLTDRHLLFWSVHRHLIVYDPKTVPLVVVRVLHGARDPRALRDDVEE